MSKASDAGKSFIAGVLAKLPEAMRGQVQTVFDSADATAALEVIGTGALAQPEINRQLDDLRAKQKELDDLRTANQTWYTNNKAALEEYVAIKPEYEKLKTGDSTDPTRPAAGMSQEDVQKAIVTIVGERDRYIASAFALGSDLSAKHMHMFQEPLNMTELLSDPKIGSIDPRTGQQYGLVDAYNAKHGERVQTHLSAAEAARIQKLVDEQVKAKMAALPQNAQHPFPLRDPSPSPLDALTAERKPESYNADTAAAEYERLQAARNGAPA